MVPRQLKLVWQSESALLRMMRTSRQPALHSWSQVPCCLSPPTRPPHPPTAAGSWQSVALPGSSSTCQSPWWSRGGRLMVGASWAAPSGRQMTLVPSWQQLPHPSQHPGGVGGLQAGGPPHGTLLVPAEAADWRRPLLATDNSAAQSIRIAGDQAVFPVVYSDRNVNRDGNGASRTSGFPSGSKRSTGHKQMGQSTGSASGSSGSQQSFSSQRFVKKETAVTQLSPVKKRIKDILFIESK